MTEESTQNTEKKEISIEKKEIRREENTVFVGKKGVMGYVLAVVTQFNNGAPAVTIIPSYGAFSCQPRVPSPTLNFMFPYSKCLSVLCAFMDNALILSIV